MNNSFTLNNTNILSPNISFSHNYLSPENINTDLLNTSKIVYSENNIVNNTINESVFKRYI